MGNPNNCESCDHKKNPDGGWCYMFRDEPEMVCMAHTRRRNLTTREIMQDLLAIKQCGILWQYRTESEDKEKV